MAQVALIPSIFAEMVLVLSDDDPHRSAELLARNNLIIASGLWDGGRIEIWRNHKGQNQSIFMSANLNGRDLA